MTYTCMICHMKFFDYNYIFLWDDGFTKGKTVCKSCGKTFPISKELWKRFRYADFYWKYLMKKRSKKRMAKESKRGLNKWLGNTL